MDKTKQRIGRYVEDALAGPGNEELRGLLSKPSSLLTTLSIARHQRGARLGLPQIR